MINTLTRPPLHSSGSACPEDMETLSPLMTSTNFRELVRSMLDGIFPKSVTKPVG